MFTRKLVFGFFALCLNFMLHISSNIWYWCLVEDFEIYAHNHEVIYSLIMIVFVSAHFSQIEEVRLRLNVDVTVAPDSAPAPAPIETFTDMVDICISLMRFRLSFRLVLLMGS